MSSFKLLGERYGLSPSKLLAVPRQILAILVVLASANAHGQSGQCAQIFKTHKTSTVQIHEVSINKETAEIGTPESLSTVHRINQSIDKFILVAQAGRGATSRVYKAALPQLLDAQRQGRLLEKNPNPSQDSVLDLALKFSKLVDLPTSVSKALNGPDSLEQVLTTKIEELDRPSVYNLKTNFANFLPFRKLDHKFSFPFQYKFIFQDGLATLLDIFKDREAGVVIAGVSRRSNVDFDGNKGTAEIFLAHDLIHAFSQKYQDALFFEKYGITNVRDARALKKKTNQLLGKRILEYLKVDDKKFTDSVELTYFVLLHELALTYPVGAHELLADVKQKESFLKDFKNSINSEKFGAEYSHLKNREDSVMTAIEWVEKQAAADAAELHLTFKPKN